MSMKLLQTINFEINEDLIAFEDRYPHFKNGIFYYSFSLSKNNETNNYTMILKPNYFNETADLTINNENEEAIILNLPINTSENIDFFQNKLEFNKHKLLYNKKKKVFEIYEDGNN